MSESIKQKWWAYHKRNPQVYEGFKQKALMAARKKRRFSAMAIIQILRWETSVEGDDEFKINNNYAPYYARLFEIEHPEHKGFFVKRSI